MLFTGVVLIILYRWVLGQVATMDPSEKEKPKRFRTVEKGLLYTAIFFCGSRLLFLLARPSAFMHDVGFVVATIFYGCIGFGYSNYLAKVIPSDTTGGKKALKATGHILVNVGVFVLLTMFIMYLVK